MAEKTENPQKYNTCLEDITCAEMIHKMLGRKGVGSLCADMLQKMMEQPGEGGRFSCAEMLRSMMKGGGDRKTEAPQTQAEEGHVRDK